MVSIKIKLEHKERKGWTAMIVPKGIKKELKWFYDSKFGMFIHFGIYALLGRGEWAMLLQNIQREEYIKLAEKFNPCKFDPDAWVGLAIDAGAKYITVTAKHHDGFCLFDSSLTNFKITNTPFKRDLIKELVDACHKTGMRIILYYSQPDWNHPNYVHNKGAFKDLLNPPKTDIPDWPKYQEYYIGQIKELCTRYGKIDGIWFDGSHKTVEEWKGKEVYSLIKKYQPHAVVNDRARYGDFFTPEKSLPEDLSGYLFESCESISSSWGYMLDKPSHNVPFLVRSAVKMVTSGGNYLLNVGPAPDGSIPEKQEQVMRKIGYWMKTNCKAVYNTDPVFLDMPKEMYKATKDDKSLYIYCIDWPDTDRIIIPGISSKPKSVKLLGSNLDIKFKKEGNSVELYDLPIMPGDPLVQVFEIVFPDIPKVEEKPIPKEEVVVIDINSSGKTELYAELAQLNGYGVKGKKIFVHKNPDSEITYLDGWLVPEHEASWRINCQEDGRYKLSISVSCPKEHEGSVICITVARKDILVDMPAVNQGFHIVEAGSINLIKGETNISIKPKKMKWGYIFGKIEKIILVRD
jgi:alpha-L-fucosidase